MNKEGRQRNREEWQRRMDEWKASGLTQEQYCKKNDLKIATFHYWRKKVSERKATGPAFVEVPLSLASRISPIRIEIGHRFCVEVGKGYDPASLEHIIGFLSRA